MMRAVLCALLAVPLAAQTVIKSSGASGSGGATTLDGLTDVTITSAADGDGLRHNGTAFVNTALFTAGTSDILAARMATNWGTAGTSACATSGGVLYDNGTAIVCEANFTYNGSALSVKSGVSGGIAFGNTLYIKGANTGNYALFQTGAGQNGFIFSLDGTEIFRLGGSQTALIQDQTATTGDTSFKVLSGAGESGNCQEWDDDGTGALASVDCETGNSVFSNVTLGTTGATFYGPSASEPIDCTTSNDGSMYFDTDDQKLCICANDGTDDEWLHSDNYGHVIGHCSI